MNWTEERWIKLYRRASPSFYALSWQARGLFRLIITELEPTTGRLELGRLGLRAVAVAVRGTWAEMESFLSELLEDGCLLVDGDELVCPNFVDAQEAVQSGALRMQKHRQRKRDEVTPKSDEVTRKRDESSRKVTRSDAALRRVTRGDESDDQIRGEEIIREEKIPERQIRIARATEPERGVAPVVVAETEIDPTFEPDQATIDRVRMNLAWSEEQVRTQVLQFVSHFQTALKDGKRVRSSNWNAKFLGWCSSKWRRVDDAQEKAAKSRADGNTSRGRRFDVQRDSGPPEEWERNLKF